MCLNLKSAGDNFEKKSWQKNCTPEHPINTSNMLRRPCHPARMVITELELKNRDIFYVPYIKQGITNADDCSQKLILSDYLCKTMASFLKLGEKNLLNFQFDFDFD